MSAMTSSVAGLITPSVRLLSASTHLPSIYIFFKVAVVVAMEFSLNGWRLSDSRRSQSRGQKHAVNAGCALALHAVTRRQASSDYNKRRQNATRENNMRKLMPALACSWACLVVFSEPALAQQKSWVGKTILTKRND